MIMACPPTAFSIFSASYAIERKNMLQTSPAFYGLGPLSEQYGRADPMPGAKTHAEKHGHRV
jgi:hypothetical protein